MTILECLRAGICPFCGRQYRIPSMHITRVHGVDRFEIRDLAGVSYETSVVPDEVHEAISARAQLVFAQGEMPWIGKGSQRGHKKTMRSAVWLEQHRSRLKKANDKRVKIQKEDVADILQRRAAGETVQAIAKSYGVHRSNVWKKVKEAQGNG